MDTLGMCVDWLKKLGLQEYQAKAYVAVVSNPDSFGPDIAEASGVPEPKIFGILKALEREGLVISSLGRPKRYRAIDVRTVGESLIDRHMERVKFMRDETDKMIGFLDGLSADKDDGKRETVWMVVGERAVENEIVNVIKSVKKEINVMLTKEDFIAVYSSKRILEAIRDHLIPSGVKWRNILPDVFYRPGSLETKDMLHRMGEKVAGLFLKVQKAMFESPNIECRVLPAESINVTLSTEDDKTGCVMFKKVSDDVAPKKLIFEERETARIMVNHFFSLWEMAKEVKFPGMALQRG
ncbi:hypothetical protein A3K63_04860 [Candidatus Micrarchaeota archaeon RBG_16_49_10]|nr:MAG: hypothetical protein A3K63_04860 [Candidatus Micrarchaeota archaeon RBG_16_49_10]